MDNSKDNKEEELYTCMACIGSGELYDVHRDTAWKCRFCDGKGEATEAENELFFSTIILKN